MVIVSSILAWEIPWIEEPGGVQSMRFKESDVNCQYEALIYLFLTSLLKRIVDVIGEGNGNPLQYSCLENPMDGGAWWAAIHGASKSRT